MTTREQPFLPPSLAFLLLLFRHSYHHYSPFFLVFFDDDDDAETFSPPQKHQTWPLSLGAIRTAWQLRADAWDELSVVEEEYEGDTLGLEEFSEIAV